MFTCLKRQVSKCEGVIKKKIVVVGDGECGKTCLLWRFLKGTFCENVYKPTLFEVDVTKVYHEDKEVELALYDTAGQENYSQLRPVSYPRTDIIIICFSLDHPDSLENVTTTWWPEIHHYCPGVPVILVGTKKDLRDESINGSSKSVIKSIDKTLLHDGGHVQFKQGQAVADKIGALAYLECSAKWNIGVETVFRQATQIVVSNIRKRKRRGR